MLRQRREDQRQARWLGVLLQDSAVDGTEKAFRLDVHLSLSPPMTLVHGRVPNTHASVRGNRLAWLAQFFSQGLAHRLRDTRVKFDLVQNITVTLKELDPCRFRPRT